MLSAFCGGCPPTACASPPAPQRRLGERPAHVLAPRHHSGFSDFTHAGRLRSQPQNRPCLFHASRSLFHLACCCPWLSSSRPPAHRISSLSPASSSRTFQGLLCVLRADDETRKGTARTLSNVHVSRSGAAQEAPGGRHAGSTAESGGQAPHLVAVPYLGPLLPFSRQAPP